MRLNEGPVPLSSGFRTAVSDRDSPAPRPEPRASKPFDIVVFDFDGTLASSVEGIAACMSVALQRFGYAAPSLEDVKATVGLTLEASITRLTGFACRDSQLVDIVTVYRELHASEAAPRVTLFEGAEDVLRALRLAGFTIVLVSNKGSAGLLPLLDQLGIRSYFDLVLSADRVKHHKPAAALYETHIASEFPGIARERTLIVGDTESDLQFAANVRAQSCWAVYGYGDAAACAALNPTFRISAIDELSAVCGLTISS